MGRTPIFKLLIIKDPYIKQYVSTIFDVNPCHVFSIAKHYRLTFPVSTHKSTTLFEFIHCDIWGSNPVKAYDGTKYFPTIVDDFSRSTWIYLIKKISNQIMYWSLLQYSWNSISYYNKRPKKWQWFQVSNDRIFQSKGNHSPKNLCGNPSTKWGCQKEAPTPFEHY